jgi:hypothetical protein
MNTVKLVVIDGRLYFPDGGRDFDAPVDPLCCKEGVPSMLIHRYHAGDIDTIPWPLPLSERTEWMVRLSSALYDERETNDFFPSDAAIELPDGHPIDFDQVLVTHGSGRNPIEEY